MSWIDKHYANKKLSIITSIATFILGIAYVIVNLMIRDRTITQEEAIAIVILFLGLKTASSLGSDLRGFLKILKGDKSDSTKIDSQGENK